MKGSLLTHLLGASCLAAASFWLISLILQERKQKFLRKRDHQDGWMPWEGRAFKHEEKQPLLVESIVGILIFAILGFLLLSNQPVLAVLILLFSVVPLAGIAIRSIRPRK